MNVGVNPDLAHLLEVQGGLLDAYLQQNLGVRFAYVIYVVPADLSGPVAGVSNCHAPLIERGADFAASQFSKLAAGATLEVEAKPRAVQGIAHD